MTQEYWKWPESRWTSEDIDWKKAGKISAGIDIGAVSSQAVVMCDGKVYCYANRRTSPDIRETASQVLKWALEGTGMAQKDIGQIVATGYGGKSVNLAHKTENEIECQAKAARFVFGPQVNTVFDMGGQTCKAIKLFDRGTIRDFAVNDKCAVSKGWGNELQADRIQVPITEIGERSLTVKQDPEPVSTTCYVYANTEAMGMLRTGFQENDVLAAYLFAIVWRMYALIGRIKPEGNIAFTGGLAKNPGIVKRLEREMKITALSSPYDPQITGAIGAALFAN